MHKWVDNYVEEFLQKKNYVEELKNEMIQSLRLDFHPTKNQQYNSLIKNHIK